MELKGKVKQILPEVTGTSAKGEWKKQEFVLTQEGQYPKDVVFQTFNKDYNIKLGEVLTVSVNAESREYNGRWYTTLGAWKVAREAGFTPPPVMAAPAPVAEPKDDLPF